jgi:hypothetical protein
MNHTTVRTYRIAPEYRRCCWYAMIGFIAVAVTVYGAQRYMQAHTVREVATVCGFIVILAALSLTPLRWKLRVDEHGVARRLFWRWQIWSWSDFVSGRITRLPSYTFCDPARPWWRRTLRLEFMDHAEARQVLHAIEAHYQPPAPPEAPDALTIKIGLRTSISFDKSGVHIVQGGMPHEYTWDDVQSVYINRVDAMRRDFIRLEMALPHPHTELELRAFQGGGAPQWRGATAEQINQLVRRHVSANRITTAIAGETPERRKDIEKQLAQLRDVRRFLFILAICTIGFLIGWFAWFASTRSVFGACVTVFVFAIGPSSMFIFAERMQRKQIAELLAALDDASNEQSQHP